MAGPGRMTQSSKDNAATCTKKRGQGHHGYKTHVANDKHAMVTNYRLDTTKVYDINHFEALTENEPNGGKLYADSAYWDTRRRKKLEGRGVFYVGIHRRVCGQSELAEEQKHHNRRCRVRKNALIPEVTSGGGYFLPL